MFVEYRGHIYIFDDDIDQESAWLIVKNANVANVKQIVKLIRASSLYGCSYSQHESSMKLIKPLVISKQLL